MVAAPQCAFAFPCKMKPDTSAAQHTLSESQQCLFQLALRASLDAHLLRFPSLTGNLWIPQGSLYDNVTIRLGPHVFRGSEIFIRYSEKSSTIQADGVNSAGHDLMQQSCDLYAGVILNSQDQDQPVDPLLSVTQAQITDLAQLAFEHSNQKLDILADKYSEWKERRNRFYMRRLTPEDTIALKEIHQQCSKELMELKPPLGNASVPRSNRSEPLDRLALSGNDETEDKSYIYFRLNGLWRQPNTGLVTSTGSKLIFQDGATLHVESGSDKLIAQLMAFGQEVTPVNACEQLPADALQPIQYLNLKEFIRIPHGLAPPHKFKAFRYKQVRDSTVIKKTTSMLSSKDRCSSSKLGSKKEG